MHFPKELYGLVACYCRSESSLEALQPYIGDAVIVDVTVFTEEAIDDVSEDGKIHCVFVELRKWYHNGILTKVEWGDLDVTKQFVKEKEP